MKQNDTSLETYCQEAKKAGAAHALITNPGQIITAPWVQWKCQFGCSHYTERYCCPPYVPTSEETRQVIDSYNRLILLHFQYHFKSTSWPPSGAEYKRYKNHVAYVISFERGIFLDGFYRAFAMPHGHICEECTQIDNQPCSIPEKARPSMESVGIDVFQTAGNHNLPIQTIRSAEDVCNFYALVLVD